jgi:class 3 adenylate cyclase
VNFGTGDQSVSLKGDLEDEVRTIFEERWDDRDGNVIPHDGSVTLGNVAVKLNATVLYADLSDSTHLVDGHKKHFAAEIYKAYLKCCAKIINSEGGTVTAYDGDRVMAVYDGNPKNTPAVRTALKIVWAVQEIVVPAMKDQYPNTKYMPKCVIGVDTSALWVAKTGVRNANDLVWVGRAANYAAKLSSLPDTYPVYITEEVFKGMRDDVKFSDRKPMWESVRWNSFDNRTIYRSSWRWGLD